MHSQVDHKQQGTTTLTGMYVVKGYGYLFSDNSAQVKMPV